MKNKLNKYNPEEYFKKGALVRTVRQHSQGLHRVLMEGTKMKEGKLWAFGGGWEYPVTELEVIRSPV